MRALVLLPLLLATPALAGPLTGKSYIVEMTSSQMASGLVDYLLPPLTRALQSGGLHPHKKLGPGADIVANVTTGSDVGQWVGEGEARLWLYTITARVGLSPETYALPIDGTPAFGVTASLMTENPDRLSEMNCLIRLATLTALRDWQPQGAERVDGQSCAR